MHKTNVKKIIMAAMFLALGVVLPFLTGQAKEIGDSLLPMHIPVMLCGLLCGARYGFFVGLAVPFLRAVTVGMPPLYPNAVWMAAELATYGAVIGFLYGVSRKKSIRWLYGCLLLSMLAGRVVWGVTKAVLMGVGGKVFTFAAFFTGGFIDAVPGIIIQLILIPAIMKGVALAMPHGQDKS